MDFNGSYLLLADRDAVWQALNDTSVLKEVIPGCEYIEWTGTDTLDLGIKVNLGPMSPTLGGELVLSEVDPAVSYVLSGRGQGKMLGLAHGAARILLNDYDLALVNSSPDFEEGFADWPAVGAGTLLRFEAEGGASGKMMRLGKKLLGKSAQKIINGFFVRFADAMDTKVTPFSPPPPPVSSLSSTSLERS